MPDARPIRLAILGTRGIPARYGGFETFAEELSVRLAALGVDVTVYCEGSERPQLYRGVRLEYVTAPSCGPLTTILFDARCLWRARRGFDVDYMLGYGAAPLCLIPRLSGTRVWLNVDGIEWARAKWGLLARSYFKLMEFLSLWAPDLVVADASAIADHLRSRHRVRLPVEVIPYGAAVVTSAPDPSTLDPWGLAPDGYYLVVCRLEPENHVREMVAGYLASSSNHPLVVVGDHRSGTSYVRDLVANAGGRVRFVGTVFDAAQLRALRFHAFAYLHGHSVGGTNPSLLEALGCGNAVLAHDNVFNREVARDAAVYFRNEHDMADCIRTIELDTVARHNMQSAARNIVERHYQWPDIAARYLALLGHSTVGPLDSAPHKGVR